MQAAPCNRRGDPLQSRAPGWASVPTRLSSEARFALACSKICIRKLYDRNTTINKSQTSKRAFVGTRELSNTQGVGQETEESHPGCLGSGEGGMTIGSQKTHMPRGIFRDQIILFKRKCENWKFISHARIFWHSSPPPPFFFLLGRN